MKENGNRLTCQQARQLDLVQYLNSLGFSPSKIRGHNLWYRSPLRGEKTPSFKVNTTLNTWFDFGIGKGGTIIDFGLQYFGCSLTDLLTILAGENLAPAAPKPLAKTTHLQIVIREVKPLTHPGLNGYLHSRKIPLPLASRFCKEVVYQNGPGTYFAVGFKNDLGGYELRSRFFKGSSRPKGITHMKTGSAVLLVFEGFIDFLSFLVLSGKPWPTAADVIVLNGLGFFPTITALLENYQQVYLLLDNDKAGQNCSTEAISANPQKFTALNHFYRDNKDINDFLCQGKTLTAGALPNVLKPP